MIHRSLFFLQGVLAGCKQEHLPRTPQKGLSYCSCTEELPRQLYNSASDSNQVSFFECAVMSCSLDSARRDFHWCTCRSVQFTSAASREPCSRIRVSARHPSGIHRENIDIWAQHRGGMKSWLVSIESKRRNGVISGEEWRNARPGC